MDPSTTYIIILCAYKYRYYILLIYIILYTHITNISPVGNALAAISMKHKYSFEGPYTLVLHHYHGSITCRSYRLIILILNLLYAKIG